MGRDGNEQHGGWHLACSQQPCCFIKKDFPEFVLVQLLLEPPDDLQFTIWVVCFQQGDP